jgi:hypothetical protein
MNNESYDPLEQQLASSQSHQAPTELRTVVLAHVSRRLTAAKWDRRLGRMSISLLILGVGLNLLMVEQQSSPRTNDIAHAPQPETIVQMGIVMAEVTDTKTADQFARRLAALGGWTLTDQQTATIRRGAQKRSQSLAPSRKEG